MNCILCNGTVVKGSKLCKVCDDERLLAASLERVCAGTGLTYSNVEEYNETNWIKHRKIAMKINN